MKMAETPTSPVTGAATTTPTAAPKSDLEALQGKWTGKDLGGEGDNTALLVISRNNLEFRGSNPDDWYKGTFTLREGTSPKQCVFAVRDCASPDYIGKTSLAIYKLENGTLTIAGNEPGNPEPPESFEATTARRFEFKLK